MEEFCPVYEARLCYGPSRNLDNRAFLYEIDFARAGAQRHETQQPAAAAEVEYYMFRAHQPVDSCRVLRKLHAIGQIAEVLV